MNNKLNMLLKAFNSLDLSLDESEILKKDIAMEMILSPLTYFEANIDGNIGRLINPESGAFVVFTSNELANEYYVSNSLSDKEYSLKEATINIEYFMVESQNGEDVSIEINPESDYFYPVGTEELIYFDEVYDSEEFRDYWRSHSSKYFKETIKNCKNQSFIDCYDTRLESFSEELLGKIENVDSVEKQNKILKKALVKTQENYQKYSKIFDDELLEELVNLKIFLPLFNEDVTAADEYNGIIDIVETGKQFNIAHIKIGDDGYMLGFSDIDKLTSLDTVFLPDLDAINKNYYVGIKPLAFVINFLLNNGDKGLILNMGCDDYFIIEVDTIIEHLQKLMRCDDLKLLYASDFALNHLYL